MIRQFRHAAGGWIWELPAGILDPNEGHAVTARRELLEETGTSADQWHYLGPMLSTPGFCDETLHVYLATGLQKGEATPEAHEFIEVHWLSADQIEEMIATSQITDAKTIVGWFKARQYQQSI